MPAFSPSQLINPNFLPTPTPGQQAQMHLPQAQSGATNNNLNLSPSALLQQAQGIINASPESGTDLFEFDQLFAQETMERAGLSMNDSDQLPL